MLKRKLLVNAMLKVSSTITRQAVQMSENEEHYYLVKVVEHFGSLSSMTRLILKAKDQESAEKHLSTVLMRTWKFGKIGAFNRNEGDMYYYQKMKVRMKQCREIPATLAEWMLAEEVMNVIIVPEEVDQEVLQSH